MKSQFLHFDSSFSTPKSNPTSTSSSTLDCYNTVYTTTQLFKKVKKIALKSLEMPIAFYNVRTGSTDTLKFIYNGVFHTVTITEANYTTIQDLLDNINYYINADFSIPSLTIAPYGATNLVFNTNISYPFSIIDTNLSKYILGFRQGFDVNQYGQYISSKAVWNLNPDNYINMYIPSFNSFNANQSSQFATFKIPLNTYNGQIYYYFENTSFPQFVEITDPSFVFSSFNVILTDKYGNNINPKGLDYSFTILIEMNE